MFGLGSATVLQTRVSFNSSRAESKVSLLLYRELVNEHQKAGQKEMEKSKHVRNRTTILFCWQSPKDTSVNA
jgi:hypothetical protein